MPDRRANTAPYEANPADLATALPTSTLTDTKHTGGDDSPTAVFLTAQTTSYPCASSTDRFETPASPEAADDGYDELDPSVQAAINQEYINSLSTRGEELSLLGRLGERVGVGLSCAAIGISALAAIKLFTGYGIKWEPDESSNFPTLTIESLDTADVADPADITNLNRQRGQEAFVQASKGFAVGVIGTALTYTARSARKKSSTYFEEAEAVEAKTNEA